MTPSRRLQTKPVITCLQTFLVSYSLIFWVTGVVVLGVGIWAKVSLAAYISLATNESNNAAIVLIATGASIIVFGLFGCIAACRGSPWMLKLYAMFLSLVFVAELGAGISGFIFRHEIKSSLGKVFNTAVTNYDGTSTNSVYVDYIQKKFHCCGVHNYTDWEETAYFKDSGFPVSCCRTEDCTPDQLKNVTQAVEHINQMGCFIMATGAVEGNLGIVAGVSFGIAFFQIIGICLAICLSRTITSNQYEMV